MYQYTINDLTSIIKVSKQSIYKLLNKDKAFLSQHTTRKQRIIYYDNAVLDKLKEYYGITEIEEQPLTPSAQEAIKAPEMTVEAEEQPTAQIDHTEEITALHAQIEVLKQQLEEKDKQIATLEAKEQELIKQNSLTLLLLQEEKQEKQKLLPEKLDKKPWWQRLFAK